MVWTRSLVIFTLLLTTAIVARAEEPKPNVVFIISDDHGWRDYGFQGHPQIQTPNIDRLAKEGRTFPRGYVPSSLCCPSLASLITGLPPQRHKVTSNDPPIPVGMKPGEFQKSDAFRDGRQVMNKHLEAVPTVPRLLASAGYLTLQTGKWWQGDYSHGGFTHGMTKGQRHGDEGLDIGRKTMQPIDDFLALAKEQKKPFMIWYAPMMPHTPHNPPERLLAKYRDKTPSIHVARYWAMVEWFDETCGQLLDKLDKAGVSKNTIVVYLADNGWTQNPDKGDSIRSKRTPYDAGLRTPIIIRWPGQVKPGIDEHPVSSTDIAPTVLKAVGLPVPTGMTGVDLRDEKAVAGREVIPGACFTHNAVDLNNPSRNVRHRWIVRGTWKLIWPHVAADADGPGSPELYDLAADPDERMNLAGKFPERVKAMKAELDAWWTP